MAGMVEYKTPQQIAREAGFVAASPDGAPMPARAPVEPPPQRPAFTAGDMAMHVLGRLLRTDTSAAALLGLNQAGPAIMSALMPTRTAQAAAVPGAAPAAATQAGMVPAGPEAAAPKPLSSINAAPIRPSPPAPPWYERMGLVPSSQPQLDRPGGVRG